MYIREMINKGTSTTHITTLESGGYINIQTLADGTKTFSWAEDLPAAVLNIDKDGIDFSTNLALGELQCAAIKMGNNAIAQAAPSALQQGAVWATALAKGGAVTKAVHSFSTEYGESRLRVHKDGDVIFTFIGNVNMLHDRYDLIDALETSIDLMERDVYNDNLQKMQESAFHPE